MRCCSRLQIADEEPGRVLPCLVRIATKTEHAAEDALAGRDVDKAEMKAGACRKLSLLATPVDVQTCLHQVG
jgi:hypothetical protein